MRVWLLLLLCGCVDQPTQVLVRLATNIPDISTLVIRIFDDEGGLVREQTIAPDRLTSIPGDGNYHQLGTFGLVPQDDDPNRRFRVAADITVSRPATIGTVRFETRARSGFVAENTIRLDIYIAELCIELAAMCEEEGLTCGIDGCVPEDIPPESLPPIDEPVPDIPIDPRMFDAGMDAGLDGATDAPRVDVPGMDVPGADVPGVDAPGVDTGMDAPATDGGFPDVGADAGPMDGGMLVPGDDGAPSLYPWNGFRFEGVLPTIAFQPVPGAFKHVVFVRDFGSATLRFVEPVPAAPGPVIVHTFLRAVSGDPAGRFTWEVLSCTDDLMASCSAPVGDIRYAYVNSVRCDVDGDGDSDLVSASDDGTVRAWVDGVGAAPRTVAAASGTATVVTCADLDGDNDAELVTGTSPFGQVRVFDWTGAAFGGATVPFSLAVTAMATADFDGDGSDDVAFSDSGAGVVQVAFGNAGSLVERRTVARSPVLVTLVPDAAGRFGRDLAITDVDGDGFADLITTDANQRDLITKEDSGFQVNYGSNDRSMFVVAGQGVNRPMGADDQNFGHRVVGLGQEAQGRGVFVIGAPEADVGNTGGVWEYRQGLGAPPTFVRSPRAADGNCCFPSDLEPTTRGFGAQNYWAGYGDLDNGGLHRGHTFRCSVGAGCTPIAPPGMVNESYFGFDILGDFDGDRMVALGRSGAQNGAYVYTAGWMAATGFGGVTPLTRLAD